VRQKLPQAPRLTLLTATINPLKEEGRRKGEERENFLFEVTNKENS
jgi:hypothetical protein